MANIFLPDGTTLPVDSTWGPEEVKRRIKEHQANPQVNAAVPTGAGEAEMPGAVRPEGSAPAAPDPSEQDPWGTWIDKQVKSAVRGTAGGYASTLDMLKNYVVDPLTNDYRIMKQTFTGDKTPVPIESYTDQPVRSAFERNVIPQPQGRGYERTATAAEIAGPAIVETALTGSPKSAFAREGIPGTLKEIAKIPARAGKDVVTGVAGGEVGGAIGEKLGGEQGRMLGTVIGAASAPTATSKTAATVERKALTNARSADKLAAVDDFNARRGPNVPELRPSLGMIGNKGAAIAEDITGRGIVSGSVAQEARRGQYEALEAGTKDVTDQIRGGPAGRDLSKEDIGGATNAMAGKAQDIIDQKISALQNDLEARVGTLTPTSPAYFENRLNNILANRGVSEQIKDGARQLLFELKRNYPTQKFQRLNPITGMMEEVTIQQPPTYGAVKDVRSEVGRILDQQGRPLQKRVQAEGYSGLTEGMKDAALHKGVMDFDTIQAETKRLYDQANHIESTTGVSDPNKPSRPKTERASYDTLFGGRDRKSIDQLLPFSEHVPGDLKNILADSLELRLRGEGNAGKDLPQPETFDIKNPRREWSETSQDFKNFYTQGDPNKQAQLNNIATLARADEVRPGKRTVPGSTGSTIGATAQLAIPSLLGGAGALVHSGDLASIFAGAIGAPLLAAGTNALTARYLTSPATVRRLVNPPPRSILRTAGSATGGVAAESGWEQRDLRNKAIQEEGRRRLREMYGMK